VTGRVGSHQKKRRRFAHAKHAVTRFTPMVYRRLVLAVVALLVVTGSLIGTSAPSVTGATATSTATTPLPPTSVSAVQDGVAPDVLVSWKPSTVAHVATGAVVQEYQVANDQYADGKFITQLTCENSCTSIIFRALSVGTLYAYLVWPTNASGTGTPLASVVLTPQSTCAVGACVTFNTASTISPVNYAASGILESLYPVGKEAADTTALHTTMYRGTPSYNANGTLNWSTWNEAVASGAKTTLVLSSLWTGFNGGPPPTPWSNWSAYTSWVTSTVTTIVNSGEQVNYWEVYNEPGETGYYSAANYATLTTPLVLQQFLVTYNAIKAADPSAAVIGPSLEAWSDYPGEYGTSSDPDLQPDMVTFLNFAVANGIKLAAISWHEIADNLGPDPAENTQLPANIEDHVAEARQLIAARPALGNPLIFINEYAMPEVQLIPGWDVSYLAALTNAGVNYAGRSCWDVNCGNPTLDGLLATDGTTPWNDYFVHQIYASMSGNMITATSTNDFVSALGSYNSSTGTFTGLVGRGIGCPQESWCTYSWPGDSLSPPAAVSITVDVPWSSGTANIALTDVPGQNLGPMTTAPVAVDSTAPITSIGGGTGTVTISIPSFLDGDAYGITITN
jgi:hypothetical protein